MKLYITYIGTHFCNHDHDSRVDNAFFSKSIELKERISIVSHFGECFIEFTFT